jgi:hypothetical protein
MKYRNSWQREGLTYLAIVAALCALRCTDESDDSSSGHLSASGGSGGEDGAALTAPSPQGGEAFGSIVICGGRTKISQCDPVSAEPCDGGSTCDHFASFGGYKCFANPEPAGPNEFCDNETVFCGPGLFCESTTLMVCQHYCCESSDCVEGDCYGGFYEDGEATIGFCFDEYGGKCAFPDDDGNFPEECSAGAGGSSDSSNSAGAGGSAP